MRACCAVGVALIRTFSSPGWGDEPLRYFHVGFLRLRRLLLKDISGISRDVSKLGFIRISRSYSSGISMDPSCSSFSIWKVLASSDIAARGALAAQAEHQPIRRTASRYHRPFSAQERGLRRTHLKRTMLEIGGDECWGRPAGGGSFKVCRVQPAI